MSAARSTEQGIGAGEIVRMWMEATQTIERGPGPWRGRAWLAIDDSFFCLVGSGVKGSAKQQ